MLNGRLGKDFVIYNQPLIWVWRGLWHNKKNARRRFVGCTSTGNRTRIKGLGNLRSIH